MKTNITRTIALLLALLVHQLSLGQTLKQGAYHDRAYGQLTITTADRSGGQKFSIYAEGSNGHACDFDGLVRNGVAELNDGAKNSCFINFEQTDTKSIRVFIDEKKYPDGHSICRANGASCGFRAWFEGNYEIRPAICEPKKVQAQRDTFIKAYKSKQYESALNTITDLKNQCEKWMHWMTQFDVVNDTAITFYRLGKKQRCLNALKPYLEAANKPVGSSDMSTTDDEGVWELIGSQPSFYDSGYTALKAIRTNLRLCGHRFPKN